MKNRIYYAMAALVVAISFGACSDDEDKDLPKIDGYNNSDEVAEESLVAHWPFDGSYAESISGTDEDETFGTVGFTEGQLGEALELTEGALVYPSITAIGEANSLSSYTVSMWVNVLNNGSTFQTFFGIFPTANTDFWGNISLSAETSWFPDRGAGDTLVLKTNYVSLNDDGSLNGQDNRPDPKGNPPVGVLKGTGQWVHFAVRFQPIANNKGSLEIWGNGVSIGAYSTRDNTSDLVMRTPAVPVFGSLATSNIGFDAAPVMPSWQSLATASIDDVRVFNTALSDTEIKALYNLGVAGR